MSAQIILVKGSCFTIAKISWDVGRWGKQGICALSKTRPSIGPGWNLLPQIAHSYPLSAKHSDTTLLSEHQVEVAAGR
jgi:hypothetical protein